MRIVVPTWLLIWMLIQEYIPFSVSGAFASLTNYRALTTFLQHLRRGSKGRGAAHAGAREAYPIEYFAVLERHRDFEENGFHWHLLIKGRDFIPHEMC